MKKLIVLSSILIAVACNKGPQPINYSKDVCDFCKMTIMDKRFASQCFSKKGKNFKFDDTHCLITFLKNGGVWRNELAGIYFSDYTGKDQWIESGKVFLLKSDELHSPMGGNIAAFMTEAERDSVNNQIKGELISWDKINH